MSRMTIVRGPEELPPESILGHIRGFLFGLLDGFTEQDKKTWRKLWRRLMSLEAGEIAQIEFVIPRSGAFHRRHMAIEQRVFDSQERFTDFEQFRYWLKVGAAWVIWAAGPKGGVVPIPKSVSYAKADQAEFEQYHQQVMGFLRGPHAAPYLWKHLGDQAHEMMGAILDEFNE